MALNPLCLGTDGALRRGATKAVLVLGVAGMLHFGVEEVTPQPPPYKATGVAHRTGFYNEKTSKFIDELLDLPYDNISAITTNNEIVLAVIKIWVEQCQQK